MPKLLTAVAAGVFTFTCGAAFGGIEIEPGEWSYSMKTEIEGLGIPLPSIPIEFKACLAQSDPVFQTVEMTKAGCKVEDREESGNTLTYAVRCASNDGSTETRYENRYEKGNYSATPV